MFSQQSTGAGIPVARSSSRAKKVAVFVTTLALGTSFMALAPLSAQAATPATTPGSYAQGKFLSGSIAGTTLDRIVALRSAQARNSGTASTQESKDPLSAAVLRAITLEAPGGVQLNLGSIIDAGALSQYARAESGGRSLGASGAVSNDGAVGVGATGDGTGGNASVDLDSLLNARFASVISDLRLQVRAVAAQATGSTESASGKYTLAGLNLTFTSPALANLSGRVGSSLDGVTHQLDNLGGPNGALTRSINSTLVALDPALNALGGSATVTANVTTDLSSSVQPLLTGTYKTPGITVDFKTGTVVVDLDRLAGGLNNKPAGTEVLTDAVVNQILNAITTQVASLADQIKNKVNISLHSATVNLDVDVKALSNGTTRPAVPGVPAVPGLPAVTCGALSLFTPCAPAAATSGTPAVPRIPAITGRGLESSASVHVHGTVDQILNGGSGATATATASLLGGAVRPAVNIHSILGGLSSTLTDTLFDNSSAVSGLVSNLNTSLVNPAVTALVGGSGSSVNDALTGLLSVKLNVKETSQASSAGMAVPSGQLFTETAVRITVLKDLGSSSLATLNLAQATVGPNVPTIVVVNPNPPVTPPTSGLPGGNPLSPTGANSASGLAFTGIGIATIIAVILALLAAGAYAAREGYRRKHLAQR